MQSCGAMVLCCTISQARAEKREGFVHPTSINGTLENASVSFIIRDHDTKLLTLHETRLKAILDSVLGNYPELHTTFTIKEQYRNMREVLDTVPFVTEYAVEAMKKVGLNPKVDLIRGATDGSRMSFMGLPCPNIFTGEVAIHSRHEYVRVQDMQNAVRTIVALAEIWSNHKK